MEDDDVIVAAAEASLARQTDAAIARIRAGLDEPGDEFCHGCGEPIEAARRAALPSATRCVGCQSAIERRGKL
jgi:phage/conjugal plasmid C-4 type zinc finger TraR family protein